MAGSSNENPCAVGLHGRVDLEGTAGGPDCTALEHLIQSAREGAHVRSDDVLDEHSAGPTTSEPGGDLLRAQGVGERHGGGGGAGVGDVAQHGHGGHAGQEEIVEIRGPVDAVELRVVGAAGGEHRRGMSPTVSGALVDPGIRSG